MKAVRTIIRLIVIACCSISGAISLSIDTYGQKAEIFIGNDKGIGQNGVLYNVSEGTNEITVPTKDLETGVYLLSFRIQDDKGIWTPTTSRMIYISDKNGILGAEYFIDNDPGEGNGISLAVMKGDTFDFSVPTDNLEVGPHTLTVRTLGSTSSWDSGLSKVFLVTGNCSEIEWFINQDPGVGNGNRVAVESGTNVIMLPTNGWTSGAYLLSFRVKDSKDRWTPTTTRMLYVAEPMDDVISGEYFVDEDPGEGNATGFGFDNNGMNSFVVPTASLEIGTHYLTLRGKTASGKWIPLQVAPFTVTSSSGVNRVEWNMTFDVRREGADIILTSIDIPAESRVELLSISGIRIHNGIWNDEASPYIIQSDPSEKNMILIITTPDGIRTMKRIR